MSDIFFASSRKGFWIIDPERKNSENIGANLRDDSKKESSNEIICEIVTDMNDEGDIIKKGSFVDRREPIINHGEKIVEVRKSESEKTEAPVRCTHISEDEAENAVSDAKALEELLVELDLLKEENDLLKKNIDSLKKENSSIAVENAEALSDNRRLTEELAILKCRYSDMETEKFDLNALVSQLKEEIEANVISYDKEKKRLEDMVALRDERIAFYINSKDLPNSIKGEAEELKNSFGEAMELMRSLMEKISYGDKGLKDLCMLWMVICGIDNEYVAFISERIAAILTDSFNAKLIKPISGDRFDMMYHEATEYNAAHRTVSKCCTPGWMYNGKAITKAVVETR